MLATDMIEIVPFKYVCTVYAASELFITDVTFLYTRTLYCVDDGSICLQKVAVSNTSDRKQKMSTISNGVRISVVRVRRAS